ncbi:MAG: hypothetical protein CMH54_05820 [Myxococcales bacterium]|nr:hypothetical protein [Myxococcales bacterium]
MPSIILESPSLSSRTQTRFDTFLLVGRAPGVDLQILDTRVSKRHATIKLIGDGSFVVEDLGSRNGTKINGVEISKVTEIQDGAIIEVGDSRLTFRDDTEISDQFNRTSTVTITTERVLKGFPPSKDVTTITQLKEDYDRLRLLWKISMESSFERPMKDQIFEILKMLLQEIDADRATLLLLPIEHRETNDPSHLELLVACDHKGQAYDKQTQVSETILGEALRTKRGVLVADARMDERFDASQSVVIQGIRSTLCAPMMSRTGTKIGVIALDSVSVTAAFHQKDLVVLETLASQVGTVIENIRLIEHARMQAIARERLSRFLSPNVVDEVVAGHVSIADSGEARNVTVLFTDVREFTALSQQFAPDEVLDSLNSYFALAVDIIFKHEGTLDKFLGDGLMALFGAPLPQKDATLRAVAAAQDIQRALVGWNEQRVKEGKEPLHVGVGIASGPVVAGAVGTPQTLSYTVVGPAANLAARLCSVAGAGEILVSTTVAQALPDNVPVERPRMLELKGYEKPVPAYAVHAD